MTGDELRAARMAKGFSRKKLAALVGLHPDSVKYWERKTRIEMRGHAVRLLLQALGVEVPATWRNTAWTSFVGGNFRRITRTRNRVLAEIDFRIDYEAAVQTCKRPTACGAKTRKGRSCRAKPVPGKRRCKFHGGMSTGPKTAEGRERIAEAMAKSKEFLVTFKSDSETLKLMIL